MGKLIRIHYITIKQKNKVYIGRNYNIFLTKAKPRIFENTGFCYRI